MAFSFLLVASIAVLASAQSSFSPLRPPAIPLAVRSPFMSTWQQAGSDNGNGGYLAGEWPTFWNGQVTGWTGIVRVDNSSYTWMGAPSNSQSYVNQTAFQYTSTKSIFTMQAGPVQLTVTFLSPVTPNDLLRSSLPYTYCNVDVKSTDGKTHNVQLYSDISAEWVSGDRGVKAQWDYGVIQGVTQPSGVGSPSSAPSTQQSPTTYGTKTAFNAPPAITGGHAPQYASSQGFRPDPAHNTAKPTWSPVRVEAAEASGGLAYHRVYRQQQLEFGSINEQAEWGYWYFATANTAKLTYQSGADTTVRGNFIKSGTLTNTKDTNYRAINNAYPVFGYAINMGSVGSSTQSTLFQLSLHQKNCVQFQGTKGAVQKLPCMWNSYFSTETGAVSYFYSDYSKASSMAASFDSQVQSDSAASGGSDYAKITSLAVRQAFGAISFTNTPSKPLVFMKEISSDGNVNTVDVIFPFHPIAIYTNSAILKWLLDPLFINQEAGNWPNKYAIHDIGSSYPNATGHSDGNAEAQPLEECGNMLIMTLAYAQRANDNAYLTQHYQILKQWTGYLVQEALIPANQISTDDFAGSAANQTNLAIKGIIGIQAMAQIANRTGNVADGQNYTKIAADYITKWQGYAINKNDNPPHTTFNYGNSSSYSLLYNLFADAELGLNLVPKSVYTMQSNFYKTKFNTYGVPLDTRHTYTKADWELFCAAIAESETKNMFTSTIAKWLNVTPTNFAFTDLYDTISGNYPGIYFIARPVVGGTFSFLALNSAPKSGIVNPS
ncbi:Glutaminase A [Pseudocercospora fuligena]|uniref:Glutaminase A n=1 Tax=Pseudocercospora fuligena TaxID=685502 RepID=A0A8H6R5I9_9PEZI|nr:Glutaminase A [Pseudocercospora fuligena]